MKVMRLLTPRNLLLLLTLMWLGTACENTPSTPPSSPQSSAAAPSQSKTAPASNQGSLAAATFRGLEIKPINFTGRTYMAIRDKVPFANIQPFYASNLNKIFQACQTAGLQMDGMPSGLFYEYDEDAGQTDMAAAIGVRASKELGDNIQTIIIPAGKKALQIDYYGNYKGVADAHYAMDDYLKSNRLTQNKSLPAIEEYVTDPSTEADPKKWLTRLVYFYGE